jgi:hypothetical protein
VRVCRRGVNWKLQGCEARFLSTLKAELAASLCDTCAGSYLMCSKLVDLARVGRQTYTCLDRKEAHFTAFKTSHFKIRFVVNEVRREFV